MPTYNIIDVIPRPAERPRFSKMGHAYNSGEYRQYLDVLIWSIRALRIPDKPWHGIEAVFWFPYPKSTPKSKLIPFARHQKKPDGDNCLKALVDALEKCGVIKNDSAFSDISVKKKYSLSGGYIQFTLLTD